MANTLITPTIIAKEALMHLENNLVMAANCHRTYKKEFAKVGTSVEVRKPVKFRVKDGAPLDSVNVVEDYTTITVSSRKHVAWLFSSDELTTTIEEYSKRYIEPAAIALANKIDLDGCALYKDVYNFKGTPGTNPDSFAEVYPAAQRLDEEAVPEQGRVMVAAPKTAWGIASGLSGLYNPTMVKDSVERGRIGSFAGFESVYKDQNIQDHTVGTYAGTPLMNGTTAEGATTLVTDGWSAGASSLKKGDIITVAGVHAVNPVSGKALSDLRTFTVTADVSDSAGAMTISISPKIYSSSAAEDYLPYQTVDTLPADGAAITVKTGNSATSHTQNICYHPNAFALVMLPLALPDGAVFKSRISKNNLSIRVIKWYDGSVDSEYIRLDVLYGWKTIYPEFACRLTA